MRKRPLKTGKSVRLTGWGGAVLAVTLAAATPAAHGDSKIEPPKVRTKVAEDLKNSEKRNEIRTIAFLEKPNPKHHEVKAVVFDGIRAEIQKKGYALERSHTSHVRLTLYVHYHKGMTLKQFARKMGFESGNSAADDYWLRVHVRITVKERDVYSATCRMWHKFIPSEREHRVGWDATVWPIDHVGQGPYTLREAAQQISALLMKDLPAAK